MVSIRVRVLLFARARELCGGISELELEVEDGSTTGECLEAVLSKFPGLEEIKGVSILALNHEYVGDPIAVKNGDEIAIIPPVSGG